MLVAGGGMVGCEVADFLSERRHEVTIVEMKPDIAMEVQVSVRNFLIERLQQKGVRVMTDASIVEYLKDGAVIHTAGKEMRVDGFDTVISALGNASVNSLTGQLESMVSQLFTIGDAHYPRQAIDAIEEGAGTALMI